MKIAYLMQAGVPDLRQYPLTGPANHVVQVFNHLRDLGHETRLLAYLDGQLWKSDDLEIFELVHLKWPDSYLLRRIESAIRRVQYELQFPYIALFESLRFAMACKKILEEYDIYYERMGWMGYGGTLASRRMGIPLILEVNGDHLNELKMHGIEPHGMQRRLSVFLMKKVATHAAFSVATGEGWRQRHIQQWNIEPSHISVVENGSEIVHMLKREQLRCFQDSINSEEPVRLIFLGAFEPWQGLEILIKAIANIINQGFRLHVSLVGSGSLSQDVEKLIHELNIETYISLTGSLPMDQVAKQLSDSDIGVSPYYGRAEFSGLKLVDYKAAGLAVIASGENGQPSVIEHGRTGVIVPPGNEEELINAMIKLITDIEMRKKMGREARIEAENFHSWSHTAIELENIFKQVLH